MLESQKETSLQENTEKVQKQTRKPRSAAKKRGKFAYLNYRLSRVERRQLLSLKLQRILVKGLSPFLEFDRETVTLIVCRDEIDENLFQLLFESESVSVSEACVSPLLKSYRLKAYQVTRRFQAWNRRLRKELGNDAVISVHRKWKFSSFTKKTLSLEESEEDER